MNAFLTRAEVLMSLRALLQMMRFQASLPVSEISVDHLLRCSSLFHKKLDLYYYGTKTLTCQDHYTLTRLHDETKDIFQVTTREKYPNRAPCFYSRAFRKAEKSADGWPLEPVQLCDLLVEDIFKDLPAVGESRQESDQLPDAVQVNANASKGLSNCAGSIEPVERFPSRAYFMHAQRVITNFLSLQHQIKGCSHDSRQTKQY